MKILALKALVALFYGSMLTACAGFFVVPFNSILACWIVTWGFLGCMALALPGTWAMDELASKVAEA